MPEWAERALWIGFAIACIVLAILIAQPYLASLHVFQPSYLP